MRLIRFSALLSSLVWFGCGPDMGHQQIDELTEVGGVDTERQDPDEVSEAELRTSSTYDGQFAAAAEEFGVPPAVIKALAYSQSRYQMVQGEVEFEGLEPAFGIMGLSGEALTKAAALAGVTVD